MGKGRRLQPLPAEIVNLAFESSNGELAWKRAYIEDALIAISGTNRAILGGEVWVVFDGKIVSMIPGQTPSVWQWETEVRGEDEEWSHYCKCTVKHSLEIVRNMKVEEEVSPNVREQIFFNVTFTEEENA